MEWNTLQIYDILFEIETVLIHKTIEIEYVNGRGKVGL